MFEKIKNVFKAGVIASLLVVPGVTGACAHRVAPEPAQLPPNVAVVDNYIKGSIDNTIRPLGLGRGYHLVPLGAAAIGDDTGMHGGIWMESTAYSPYEGGAYTATGAPVRYGIAAVDTDLIPLGTNLYIEGYGHALAADVGGAIQGNRIDLAFDSYQEAMDWGRRDVLVHMV